MAKQTELAGLLSALTRIAKSYGERECTRNGVLNGALHADADRARAVVSNAEQLATAIPVKVTVTL